VPLTANRKPQTANGRAGAVWRVFYTRPRAEKQVRERLAAAGHEVFFPEREVLRQWSDRKKKVREPLFPGYLFANVDESARLDVLQDHAVVKTVSFGGNPAIVIEEEIESLKALQAVPDRIEAVARQAAPLGSEVIVTSGPLKGLRARVDGHPKPMYLLLEIPSIRQTVRVHVPADWVMRVPSGPGEGLREQGSGIQVRGPA
jgi:transcription termination/antitermination protein NusG